jgi:hypothetical protein
MHRLVVLIASILLFACKPAEPQIGRDLPSTYAEGEQVFDRRVKVRFPAGTSEQSVIAELHRQGFRLLPTREGVRDATFIRDEWIFQTIWSVRWRAKDGRIQEIWGVYGGRAP